MAQPQFNISLTGAIPTNKQTFSVSLPCTGAVSTEVNVTITVNITRTHINSTMLKLKRKKVCMKIESNNHVLVNSAPFNSDSAKIFYFAVGCAAALIFLITICVTIHYIRNKKARRSRDENNIQPQTSFLTGVSRNTSTATPSYGSFRRMPSYSLIGERTKDIQDKIAELTIQRY